MALPPSDRNVDLSLQIRCICLAHGVIDVRVRIRGYRTVPSISSVLSQIRYFSRSNASHMTLHHHSYQRVCPTNPFHTSPIGLVLRTAVILCHPTGCVNSGCCHLASSFNHFQGQYQKNRSAGCPYCIDTNLSLRPHLQYLLHMFIFSFSFLRYISPFTPCTSQRGRIVPELCYVL